jgi:hypothetical protein
VIEGKRLGSGTERFGGRRTDNRSGGWRDDRKREADATQDEPTESHPYVAVHVARHIAGHHNCLSSLKNECSINLFTQSIHTAAVVSL